MTPVLIVGAGPTGLVLALSLAKQKIPFRIIDKNSGPGLASRAIGVQARTLEFYRQLGFADEVVGSGIQINQFHLREGGRELVNFSLKDMGKGISPFPFLLSFPQDDHEKFLEKKLSDQGIPIEWNTELVSFTQNASSVQATLRKNHQDESFEFCYLCGCDGARSKTREVLNLGFPGGTYDQLFYVADVKVKTDSTDVYGNLGQKLFALMMPVRSTGMQRLVGVISPELSTKSNLSFEDVRSSAEHLIGFKVDMVNWFSTYHVHHRVVDHFRVGRAFVLGDAGHIHSPAGAQGMNTGIGDAFNLAWKIAQVIKGRMKESLLDTYEEERLPFAKILVSTTDRVFQTVITKGFFGQILRTVILPAILGNVTRAESIRRFFFNTISQVRIRYRNSSLSEGKAGRVHGGDRLPWIQDNFDSLMALDWQIHIYGTGEAQFIQQAASRGLPTKVFTWSEECRTKGLLKDAVYLIRPDGYVALASPDQDFAVLKRYISRVSNNSNL